MKTELIVKFKWIASHSLAGFENPHPHIWHLEAVLSGTPKNGKIVDIVELREKIKALIAPLENQYLNDCLEVSPEVREFPTCETLCAFFESKLSELILKIRSQHNSSLRLVSILVDLCEMDGTEMGAVRLSPPHSS